MAAPAPILQTPADDPLLQIREDLVQMFTGGVSSIRSDTLTRLRTHLMENGFQRSIALLDDLAAQTDDGNRFRSFTKLLLAMRQLDIAQAQYPRLRAGGFLTVPGTRAFAISQTFSQVSEQQQVREFLQSKRSRMPGLYLLHEKLPAEKLTLHELVPLLSHGFFRDKTLEKLATLSDERRETLAERLLALRSKPLRRAGVKLLAGLGARLSAARRLVALLSDKGVDLEAEEAFIVLDRKAVDILGTAADSGDALVRERAARLLYRIGDERAEPHLERLRNDPKSEVSSWAKVGLCRIGALDPASLKQGASSGKDAILRIFSKAELARQGHLPGTEIMAELRGAGGWRHAKLVAMAVAEMSDAEEILEQTLTQLREGQNQETRRQAFELLQHLPYRRFRGLFNEAAADADTDIARKGLEIAVRAEGFAALDRHLDLGPILSRPYEDLSDEELQYALERVFPHIPETGDCRFVPYLTGMVRDRCMKGITIEYTYSLRPALAEFGAPLIPALKELSRDPEPNIAGPAREVLQEIGVHAQ